MEKIEAGILGKRVKSTVEDKGKDLGANAIVEAVEMEETETNIAGSEEMELHISHIYEKIQSFTQMVSELLESGKAMFKEMSNEFEGRLLAIHEEQVEKWHEEIREIRLLDASNEEVRAILQNAQFLLQNPHINP